MKTIRINDTKAIRKKNLEFIQVLKKQIELAEALAAYKDISKQDYVEGMVEIFEALDLAKKGDFNRAKFLMGL